MKRLVIELITRTTMPYDTQYLLQGKLTSGQHIREMYTPLNPTIIQKKKLGFAGVYLIFLSKNTLWVLVRTASVRRF